MLTLTEQERRQKERLIEQLRKLGVEPDILFVRIRIFRIFADIMEIKKL